MDVIRVGKACVEEAVAAVQQIDTHVEQDGVDVKTTADRVAQDAILDVLRSRHVPCSVYSEELDEPVDIGHRSVYTFILDPVDGTYWYLKEIDPLCSVCILVLKHGEPYAAFVRDFRGNLYHCDEEHAYLNDERITIEENIVSRPLVSMWSPYGNRFREDLQALEPLVDDCNVVNIGGQLMLCNIAGGKADASLNPPIDLHEFAGILIAQRAGAIVTTREGGPIEWDPEVVQSFVVARNEELHQRILDCYE